MIEGWRAGSGRERAVAIAPWAVVAPWGLWALIRLFGLERGFPLVPLLAYTPYVAATALIPIVFALALRRWAAASVAAAVAVSLLAAIAPRLAPDPGVEAHGGPRLRVLSANIHEGRAELVHLRDLVRDRRPDVLSLQELTPRAAEELARLGFGRLFPHRVLEVHPAGSGAGIYSRFPTRRIAVRQFGFRMPRAVVRLPEGKPVEVVCVHPFPPDRYSLDQWKKQLASLPSAPGEGPLHVLAGDFNATLDHRELRRVLDRGYVDSADALGEGLTPTWSAQGLLALPLTIDHVLVDERGGVVDYSVHDLPGSDHQAVFAELALGPERR